MPKPIFAEAQAAVALALFLRADKTPPSSLVNSTTEDSTLNKEIKSVYTKPSWVTKDNMADTIIKDGWLTPKDLCGGKLAAACKEAGIS
jgi:D-xylose transport system substrate-binding protein